MRQRPWRNSISARTGANACVSPMKNFPEQVANGTTVAGSQGLMRGRHAFWWLSVCHGRAVYVSRLCFLILFAVVVSPALVARNSQASPSPTSTPRLSSTPTASVSPSPSPTPAPTRPTKKIIHWQAGVGGHSTLPSHMLANLAWIDSLPFDGLFSITTPATRYSRPVTWPTTRTSTTLGLLPLRGSLKK